METQYKVEVQDIFNLYAGAYRKVYGKTMSTVQHKAMRQIGICRTSALGGHKEKCTDCEKERISYNSCRNRHCPKCQFLKKEKWLEDRLKDFLPVNYFHVVFTVPDIINAVALGNQKTVYNILFRSVSETLKDLSNDKKYLGVKTGFICVLHTWGQTLVYHPHIHCIVTGGGLSYDNSKWIDSSPDFLFPVKVMSKLFRGKFLHYLKESYGKGGKLKYHEVNISFSSMLNNLYKKEWIVYSKPPFKNTETVFRYLSNYTHRIAISNHRIIKLQDDKVYFKWTDYSDSNRKKVMSLDALEFIRRFLLHVLPDRFVKIRHYGLFSSSNKSPLLESCRKVLGIQQKEFKKTVETWKEMLLRITGFDVNKCPFCDKGKMVVVETILPDNCNSPPKKI